MTCVIMERTDEVNRIDVSGHQPTLEGCENIFCAAISAMCCMLINALREAHALGVVEAVESGHVFVECGRTLRTDAYFDIVRSGMNAMMCNYPDRVELASIGDFEV